MKNLSISILESLQNLHQDWASKLFSSLLKAGSFEEKYEVDKSVMFIFPDGRLLGSAEDTSQKDNEPYHVFDGITREIYHNQIYDIPEYNDFEEFTDLDDHPVFNQALAEYYNLIIVSAWHEAKAVLIPAGCEPTQAQQHQLTHFRKLGYKIEIGE